MIFQTIKRSFLFVLPVLVIACKEKQQTQGPPPAVAITVDTVWDSHITYHDEYPGTLVALDQIELRPQVTGYITHIYFKDGQKVVKGQKLYSIDQNLYNANYQQAVANLQVQQSNLDKAQKDADRYHELEKHDAIAKQQVDYAEAALQVAKKQVSAAQANVDAVKTTLGFSLINAPFSGTIGISQVRVGTSVVAGQTVLNTVSTDNPMAVDFAVDQGEIYRFSKMMKEGLKGNDSTFTIAFGGELYPQSGHISLLDRAVDPQTGTIKTRLVFPNDKSVLKSGMSTTVRVLNNPSEMQVAIPYKSVTELLGEYFVYVLGDSSKVTQRKVVLGRQVGGDVLIKDGLQKGDVIAVQGVQNLKEGSLISISKSNNNSH
ncbi:MAG: efflux RND transporter periplasmic adaptor subunit [Bacteroidetes bacterium]|nr:efflux RND transporter periplasmic adaptor subunit [Bacteroidota bacterium]